MKPAGINADLRLENEMLLAAVHELYEKVKELNLENDYLREKLEGIEDVRK